jgi:hypothetical protein
VDIARARLLVSNDATRAFTNLPAGATELPLNQRLAALRRQMPPELASAVSEQIDLRARAFARGFPNARTWLFTPPGLEMVTHPLVASRRAERVAALGLPVADLTCGIGGDLAALVEAGARCVGVDRDAVHCLLAAHNVPSASVLRGSATEAPLKLERTAVVLDPSRREGGSRTFDPARFSPNWDECLQLAAAAPAAAIKTQPGIPLSAIPTGAEVEFVQLGRSLREAAIYVGAAASFAGTCAVHLPSGECIDSREPEAPAEMKEQGAFIYDPESCVTRAGLVRHLAHRLGARMLDPQVAYLTSDEPHSTPHAVKCFMFSRFRLAGCASTCVRTPLPLTRFAGVPSRSNPTNSGNSLAHRRATRSRSSARRSRENGPCSLRNGCP